MKKNNHIFLLLLLLFFSAPVQAAGENPSREKGEGRVSSGGSISILRRFAGYQRKGNRILNKHIRWLKDESSPGVMALLVLFALGYGMFHAVGPGHGKAIVGLYFMQRKSRLRDALKLAVVIALTHTGLALLLAVIFNTVLSHLRVMGRFQVQGYFNFASGAVVAIIGACLLAGRIRGRNRDIAGETSGIDRDRSLYAVGISAGAVPCPLSLTVILVTIPLGLFAAGFVIIAAMAAGLSAVLFLVGLLVIKSRQEILKRFEANSRGMNMLLEIFGYAGAAGIIVAGLVIAFLNFPFK